MRALGRWLIDSVGQKAIVAIQDPIHLDDTSEPQPDIALLKPRDDYYAAAHPGPVDTLLIVEVAESSLAYDLPGRRDGRRLQRLAELCQNLPNRPRFGDKRDRSDVATTPRALLRKLLPHPRHEFGLWRREVSCERGF